MGKQTLSSHSGKLPRSHVPLYRLHCDLAGPFPTQSLSGFLYTMVIIDDATRKNWIILLKCKSHAFDAFKQFHTMICNQTSFPVVIFKTDRGGEFNGTEFSKYLADHGISREMGPPESPEQKSVVERFNRTASERLRSQLIHGNLPVRLWGELMLATSFILNLCPSKSIDFNCPEEAWQTLALKIDSPNIPYS